MSKDICLYRSLLHTLLLQFTSVILQFTQHFIIAIHSIKTSQIPPLPAFNKYRAALIVWSAPPPHSRPSSYYPQRYSPLLSYRLQTRILQIWHCYLNKNLTLSQPSYFADLFHVNSIIYITHSSNEHLVQVTLMNSTLGPRFFVLSFVPHTEFDLLTTLSLYSPSSPGLRLDRGGGGGFDAPSLKNLLTYHIITVIKSSYNTIPYEILLNNLYICVTIR